MYHSINIPFKNNTIEQCIELNTKMKEIHDMISNNVNMNFDLNIDEYNISEEITSNYFINESFDKNRIKNICFYIKPNERLISNNENCDKLSECPICYEKVLACHYRKLQCSHSLCIKCYENWSNTCNNYKLNRSCPICRKGF
mgnify:CR=1 FL=1